MRAGELTLTLPSEPDALTTARDELRSWLERGGIDGADAHDIVLAAWEACANAVEHPQEPTGRRSHWRPRATGDRISHPRERPGRWRPERERAERGLGLRRCEV